MAASTSTAAPVASFSRINAAIQSIPDVPNEDHPLADFWHKSPNRLALYMKRYGGPGPYAVFGVLSCYRDKHNSACPSVATIADCIGISTRMVERHLKTLEKNKLIRRVYRNGTSSLYLFVGPDTRVTHP